MTVYIVIIKGSQQETLPTGWTALTDLEALTAALGQEIALTLPAAVMGYCDMAGIAFDVSSAKVNASAVRIDQEGTAFTVDVGTIILDVLYSDGTFGFLVI